VNDLSKSKPDRFREPGARMGLAKRELGRWLALAVVYLPVALGMKSHLQEAVFGIVPLSAAWTRQISAPRGALMIVIFCNSEGASATAGDEEHPELEILFCRRRRFVMFFHVGFSRFFDGSQLMFLAPVGLQRFLAQSQRLRGHFNELVVGDEFDCLLQVQRLERH